MNPEHRKILLVAVAVVVVGALSTWGFMAGRHEAAQEADADQPIQAPHRAATRNGEPVISVDAASQRRNGISIATVTRERHPQQLRAFGTVVDLQALTDLANASASAHAQLESARARFTLSQTAFARAQGLYKDEQNMSMAQLQAAEAALRADRAGLVAAQSQLRTLAVTAQLNWGSALSQALLNDTPLLARLTSRHDVLIQVTLRPEQGMTQPPADAWVEVDSGARAPLKFVSAATKTDPRIQGVSFFFTAAAVSGLLPGMSVVAHLATTSYLEGIVVPAAAIVWAQGSAWAYLRIGPNTFARRAVPTDQPEPSGGYVMSGPAASVDLVVQGAQMLLSEEFRAAAQVSD